MGSIGDALVSRSERAQICRRYNRDALALGGERALMPLRSTGASCCIYIGSREVALVPCSERALQSLVSTVAL